MDFWARLIGGVGSSPASKPTSTNNPQQRLARFKKVYGQLLVGYSTTSQWHPSLTSIQQTWRHASTSAADPATIDAIRAALQRITSLLHEESRTPVPHPCISFASSSRIFDTISQIASQSRNEGIIREAISAFSTLVDSEEEEFLCDHVFAESLMSFVGKVSGTSSMILGADAEGEIVELLFGIAAKIRLQPEILPVWFISQAESGRDGSDAGDGTTDAAAQRRSFEGVTHKEDFPLFYLLIGYVHHEGRVGDFARTGLLYIIESASSSLELERWLVESDLATLMASGLGALYSQLSRKLVVTYADEELPTILALSDYAGKPQHFQAESSNSPDFQTHLDTFLSYLVFWQDVLEHCKSFEVKQTLLDHFQVLFLQQLLYPSLLESSDIDGGSSVAVLTYLCRILDSLDHPDLIHLILHYLLALPEQTFPRPATSSNSAKRRKSLELLTQTVNGDDNPTPSLFNLVDLVLSSLHSKSQQTITATLKLVSVILRRHHRYAISTLLRTTPTANPLPRRTVGALDKEMDMIFSLIADIGGDDSFDETYENHVKDNLDLLECHPCSTSLLAAKSAGPTTPKVSSATFIVGGGLREVYPHLLKSDDPLLTTLLGVLGNFFTNTVETNLSLTQTLVDLASCGYMRLEGWLLVDPSHYTFDDDDESAAPIGSEALDDSFKASEQARVRSLAAARREPSWSAQNTPPLFAALQALLRQVNAYRAEIPRFDAYVSERKQAFQVSEELNEALLSTSQILSPKHPAVTSAPSVSPASASKAPTLDSISQRMFADRSPNSLSRSSSPRGRSQAALTPKTGKLQGIPTNLVSTPTPTGDRMRAYSPSPLREAAVPPSPAPPKPPSFAANTHEILARKVGLPRTVKMPFAPAVAESEAPSSGASSVRSDGSPDGRPNAPHRADEDEPRVSVSHVLTNVVVLQDFLLELAALIQVRASLFGEVRFI